MDTDHAPIPIYKRLQQAWSQSLATGRLWWRAAMAIALIWIILTLVPYAIIGESWGMIWFYLAWPMSNFWKDLWEYLGDSSYIAIVSIFNFLLAFLVILYIRIIWLFLDNLRALLRRRRASRHLQDG